MTHQDPTLRADRGEILLRARHLRLQVAAEVHRVSVTIAAARGLREEVAELAEQVAAVHDVRSSLCDRLAGHQLFPSHYWPSQAARARRIAAIERQVAAHYRSGQTPSPDLRTAMVDDVPPADDSPPR